MLNPNNDDLESLVDFLYRLINELCRLKGIRCRVDAVFITENQTIRYEFRHNVSLAVKECVNNVLKHSHATELDMKIELKKVILMITHGVKKHLPKLEVVMLSTYEEDDNIFRALKEGASGYIIKSSNSNDILEAIIKYLS